MPVDAGVIMCAGFDSTAAEREKKQLGRHGHFLPASRLPRRSVGGTGVLARRYWLRRRHRPALAAARDGASARLAIDANPAEIEKLAARARQRERNVFERSRRPSPPITPSQKRKQGQPDCQRNPWPRTSAKAIPRPRPPRARATRTRSMRRRTLRRANRRGSGISQANRRKESGLSEDRRRRQGFRRPEFLRSGACPAWRSWASAWK